MEKPSWLAKIGMNERNGLVGAKLKFHARHSLKGRVALEMVCPELDFSTTSVNDISNTFLTHGCVILRNFTEKSIIEEIVRITQKIYDEIELLHIFNHHLTDRGFGTFSSYVFTPKHDALLNKIFAGYGHNVNYPATNSRRVSPPEISEANPGWQKPLGFHIDAEFHTFAFTVNFWVPFQSCGHDAPGLAIVDAPFKEILTFTEFDGQPENYKGEPDCCLDQFNPIMRRAAYGDIDANNQISDHFGARVLKPVFEPGDAMMSSNWTLHGTHATSSMTKTRESMELRFNGSAMLREILTAHGIAL